jgi:hypothetical protein
LERYTEESKKFSHSFAGNYGKTFQEFRDNQNQALRLIMHLLFKSFVAKTISKRGNRKLFCKQFMSEQVTLRQTNLSYIMLRGCFGALCELKSRYSSILEVKNKKKWGRN